MKKTHLWSIYFLLMFISACGAPPSSEAYTTVTCTQGETGVCRQVANLTLTEVQSALDAATASDGTYYRDGVYLIAGSATWASPLDLTKAGVVLKGAGVGNTIISCDWSCVHITGAARTRATGVSFIGLGVSHSGETHGWNCRGASPNVRVDHNDFSGSFYYAMRTEWQSHCTGVADHNTIGLTGDAGAGFLAFGRYEGCEAFQSPIDFGSSDWMYVEDNSFTVLTNPDYFNTHWGGKMVLRHNIIQEGGSGVLGSFFDQHNTGAADCSSNNGTGGRGLIAHDNTVIYTSAAGNFIRGFYIRGGTALVYNNTFDYRATGKPDVPIEIMNYRARGGTPYTPGVGCDDGSTNTANSANASFCATCIARCMDTAYHPNGVGVYPQGEGYPGVGTPAVGVWNGTREPIYFWNNSFIAPGPTTTKWQASDMVVQSDVTWAVQNDREYCFSETTQPTSCGGVTLTYTEYPYPHPLAQTTLRVLSGAAKATGVIKVQ